VPLYDSGDADGLLYYVMPYESGQSLRARLRDGALPIDDAVTILRDVCDALAHAHEHGVIHRDIKPDNVLLTGRHALVTDFGVAKALASPTTPRVEATRKRDHGRRVMLGTPAYMAPEQASATPRDHRADIYAVGCSDTRCSPAIHRSALRPIPRFSRRSWPMRRSRCPCTGQTSRRRSPH
jgi:serine/threonine protein kinase